MRYIPDPASPFMSGSWPSRDAPRAGNYGSSGSTSSGGIASRRQQAARRRLVRARSAIGASRCAGEPAKLMLIFRHGRRVSDSDYVLFPPVKHPQGRGVSLPDPNGASIMALRDPTLDNNVGQNWCTSQTPFGEGDAGTPRAPTTPLLHPSSMRSTRIRPAPTPWNSLSCTTLEAARRCCSRTEAILDTLPPTPYVSGFFQRFTLGGESRALSWPAERPQPAWPGCELAW
jgi:hypothetical protein